MPKIKKFFIDYVIVYIAFNIALFVYIPFGIFSGTVIPNEIGEGVVLQMWFSLPVGLGFLIAASLISFLTKTVFSHWAKFFQALIAESSALYLWNNFDYWWQPTLLYLGVIFVYVLFIKVKIKT